MIKRKKTKQIKLGDVAIGAGAPLSIQSMVKVETTNVPGVLRQIRALKKEGCEIVRIAVRDMKSAKALSKILPKSPLPIEADIHFHYKLALEAIEQGIDGIRLNPGNIYRRKEIKEITNAAKKRRIPIRVGVNGGSLRSSKSKFSKAQSVMVQEALNYIRLLESFGFSDIMISLKSSDVAATVDAYQEISKLCDYPLHLGVTATGFGQEALVKSAIGIGALLADGIGDTLRVSATGNPTIEVRAAKLILQSLNLRYYTPEIISCPTCGRCQVNLEKIVRDISKKLSARLSSNEGPSPLSTKIAIMGCEVNGPGEAKEADIGIACGKKSGALFRNGRIIRRVPEAQIVEALIQEIKKGHGK